MLSCADEGEKYVGGFKGEWQKAPSGINQTMKLEILAKEGVKFDKEGRILDKKRLWEGFEV
jgi:methylated-DNA-[protein]-cysteine S-methyltransferase